MAFDPETMRLQREWFRMKVAGERQYVDALRRLKDPSRYDFVLLDVRDRASYEKGHIPGALSLPPEELDARAASLPKDRELVTYCWHAT